ncbi:YraN family protein [Risungbinella massiliensis]|uniref:YraN family protein n=1 Tax=Risungbinella massiliensis TaxID=1329796 RepID=UPI0005CC529E|nr:YraN family protein [Risungbinella massiliensis]
MDPRKEIGRIGEEAATRHLEDQGYQILNRNWSTRLGELDIIATDQKAIIFVEVRTTSSKQFGYGYQSVDFRKQHKVRRLALQYLQNQQMIGSKPLRFDVVSVLLNGQREIQELQHIPAAF